MLIDHYKGHYRDASDPLAHLRVRNHNVYFLEKNFPDLSALDDYVDLHVSRKIHAEDCEAIKAEAEFLYSSTNHVFKEIRQSDGYGLYCKVGFVVLVPDEREGVFMVMALTEAELERPVEIDWPWVWRWRKRNLSPGEIQRVQEFLIGKAMAEVKSDYEAKKKDLNDKAQIGGPFNKKSNNGRLAEF